MPLAKTFELPPLANDAELPADPAFGAGPAPAAVPAGTAREITVAPPATSAPGAGQREASPAGSAGERDIWDTSGAPAWLATMLRLVRPMSVGALIAVPTVGAASCGLASIVDADVGLGMARASTLFLQGIPGEVYMLVGFFGGGYGLARTVERLRGVRG